MGCLSVAMSIQLSNSAPVVCTTTMCPPTRLIKIKKPKTSKKSTTTHKKATKESRAEQINLLPNSNSEIHTALCVLPLAISVWLGLAIVVLCLIPFLNFFSPVLVSFFTLFGHQDDVSEFSHPMVRRPYTTPRILSVFFPTQRVVANIRGALHGSGKMGGGAVIKTTFSLRNALPQPS